MPNRALSGTECRAATSNLLRVTDQQTRTTNLNDSEAEVSILPCPSGSSAPTSHSCSTSSQALYSANSTLIPTGRSSTQNADLSMRPFTAHSISLVQQPIIGADFLHKHRILNDLSGCCLLLPGLTSSVLCSTLDCPPPHVSLW